MNTINWAEILERNIRANRIYVTVDFETRPVDEYRDVRQSDFTEFYAQPVLSQKLLPASTGGPQ